MKSCTLILTIHYKMLVPTCTPGNRMVQNSLATEDNGFLREVQDRKLDWTRLKTRQVGFCKLQFPHSYNKDNCNYIVELWELCEIMYIKLLTPYLEHFQCSGTVVYFNYAQILTTKFISKVMQRCDNLHWKLRPRHVHQMVSIWIYPCPLRFGNNFQNIIYSHINPEFYN